jgi:CHAT domain-containing protein/predicted negative regulator of RcsB-dependent stress response
MAARDRQSKRWQTAEVGRRRISVTSQVAVLFPLVCILSSCSGRNAASSANPSSLFQLAQTQYKHGELVSARQSAGRGYVQFQAQPQSKWHWQFDLQFAEMLLWNGDTNQAQPLLAQAPPPQFADLLPQYQELRGYLLYRTHRNADGRELLAEAIQGAHAAANAELEAEAHLLLGACILQYEDGEPEARSEFENALAIAESHQLAYEKSAALVDLGLVDIRREHYGDAIPYLERALDIAKSSGALQLGSLARLNLASCHHNLGELDKALVFLREAAAEESGRGLATALSEIYSETGDIYLQRTQTASAIYFFRQALDLVHEDAPFQYALAAGGLAEALTQTGFLDEAEQYNQRGLRVLSKGDAAGVASLTLNKAAIAERRKQYSKAVGAYRQAIDISKDVPSVRWEAYAGLAKIYGETSDFNDANRSYENALQVIAGNRADQLRSEYKITFLSDLIRFYQDYVALLMKQNQPERALEIADSSRASVLTQDLLGRSDANRKPLLSRIQKAAKTSESTFLFYWLAPKNSYLWVITGSGAKAVLLGDQKQINRDVESYRMLIQQEKRDPLTTASAVGKRLYQTLIAPVAQFIPPGGRVIVVPDGSLHNLNFETLIVDKPTPHYWIDDVTISIAPSLGILQARQETRSGQQSLLVIGDPVTEGTGYQPLPEAALEIQEVQRHYPSAQTVVYTKDKATPGAYGAARPQKFSTIHFATHVEANEQSPLDSAIILSLRQNAYKLYARDVAEMPLSADLVTISACRGAGARTLSGEGLVGLAWAFFQAGAKNVVTSLWDVNDRSTADLMDRFYGGVASGKSYADALRDAKLQMLHSQYAKPYYWAPFQLYSRSIIRPTTKPRETQERASNRRTQRAFGQ